MSTYCPQCGAPANPGATKCEYCGAAIQAAQPAQPQYQQPVYQQPVYQQPVQPQVVYMQQNERANWPVKSKIVAILLALFLGGIGVHQFYLGTGKGIWYLLFCWTGIPSIIALIDLIVMATSSDENFMIKYKCRIG